MTERNDQEYSIDRGPFRFETLVEEMRTAISNQDEGIQFTNERERTDHAIIMSLMICLGIHGVGVKDRFELLRATAERLQIPGISKQLVMERIDYLENWVTRDR